MARAANTNFTVAGEDFEIADAAGDAIERGDLQKLAKAVDNHTHASTRGAGVRRLHTTSAPTTTGEVQVTGDDLKWWGASAGAVRTALSANAGGEAALGAGKVYINDTSNANMTVGLTINQGANDDELLALKSSDVAHGVTSLAETDTFAAFAKASTTDGGLSVKAFNDAANVAMFFEAVATTDDTTKSSIGTAPLMFQASKKSGVTTTSPAANANLAAFYVAAVGARFLLDVDGDSHQDVGTAWTNFDAWDDVGLLTTLADAVARPGNAIRDEFRRWIGYHRGALEAAGLVTFNDDGHHFVNMSRLTMLLVGAVRQQAARVAALEERLTGWETRLLALEGAGEGAS